MCGSSTLNYKYSGSRYSNKLIIVAGVITFVVIIIESVVVVEAGHRGVVLYVGAVENRVLGEGIHFIIPFAGVQIVWGSLFLNIFCSLSVNFSR